MFRINLPIRIMGIFAGILAVTAFLCIIVSYNTGLANAVVSIGQYEYKPSDAEKLIKDNIDESIKLKAALDDLQNRFQGLDINYTTLIKDFDKLNNDYKTSLEELNKQKEENAELNTINENMNIRDFELSNRLDALEKQKDELNDQIDDLKLQIESLNTQLSNLKKTNNQLNVIIESLKKRLNALNSIFRAR